MVSLEMSVRKRWLQGIPTVKETCILCHPPFDSFWSRLGMSCRMPWFVMSCFSPWKAAACQWTAWFWLGTQKKWYKKQGEVFQVVFSSGDFVFNAHFQSSITNMSIFVGKDSAWFCDVLGGFKLLILASCQCLRTYVWQILFSRRGPSDAGYVSWMIIRINGVFRFDDHQ